MPATIAEPIREGTTALLTATLRDETGAAVPGTALATLVLTLYRRRDGKIINGRQRQNILGANGGAVDVAGKLTLTLGALDNVVLDPSARLEEHACLIEFTTIAGSKPGTDRIGFHVERLVP